MNENRFNKKGEIYAKSRPSYPLEFMDYLYKKAILSKDSKIADIGSGTGLLTKCLLEQNSTVYAVEPNDDMRRVAERELQQFNRFHSIYGTAENTTLGDKSIDCITVGQAFHWFDKGLFRNECRRILKTEGKVVLVWNARVEQSEIVAAIAAINKRYCPNFNGFSENLMNTKFEKERFVDFFVGDYDIQIFENNIELDKNLFVDRNLSSSYAPNEEDKNYTSYIKALEEVFAKFSKAGFLTFPYSTRSYIGKVSGRLQN
jgi:Methylase involved in ubiquinone/menaquinone biosynthesis